VLLQYPDNLFFGVSAALHRPSPSRNGLYLKARAISGSRSELIPILAAILWAPFMRDFMSRCITDP
jgi:hypothetical protein